MRFGVAGADKRLGISVFSWSNSNGVLYYHLRTPEGKVRFWRIWYRAKPRKGRHRKILRVFGAAPR